VSLSKLHSVSLFEYTPRVTEETVEQSLKDASNRATNVMNESFKICIVSVTFPTNKRVYSTLQYSQRNYFFAASFKYSNHKLKFQEKDEISLYYAAHSTRKFRGACL